MKHLRFALILLDSLLLATFLIGLILPGGCSKDPVPDPVPEEEPEDYTDLVAYFSGIEATLYVLPQYQEAVLASLGADPIGAHEAVAVMVCYDGAERLSTFKVLHELEQSTLAAKASSAREKAVEKLKKLEDALKERPVDKQSFKGRECLNVPEKYGTCHTIGATSTQTYKYPRQKCQPVAGSDGICTETNTLGMAESRTYNNRDCTGDYKAKEIFEWVCQK